MASGIVRVPPHVHVMGNKGDVAGLATYAQEKFDLSFPDDTPADQMVDAMKAAASRNYQAAKAEKAAEIKAAEEEIARNAAASAAPDPEVVVSRQPIGQPLQRDPEPLPMPTGTSDAPLIPNAETWPAPQAPMPVQMHGGLIQPAPVVDEPTISPPQPQQATQPSPLAPGMVANAEASPPAPPVLLQPADPSKPMDPYAQRGLEPGGAAAQARFYDKNGNPLKPDSDPVLPEHIALQENPDYSYRAGKVADSDPFLQGANGVHGQQPSRNMPHGPQTSRRQFRHNQNVTYLVNERANMAFRPTEILMRRQDLVPHFGEMPPEGVFFGG